MASFYDDVWFGEQVAEYEPMVIDVFGAHFPSMSLLMVPLAVLDYQSARVAWTVASLYLVITACLWLMRVLNVSWGLGSDLHLLRLSLSTPA